VEPHGGDVAARLAAELAEVLGSRPLAAVLSCQQVQPGVAIYK
jgi:hypothetical protein